MRTTHGIPILLSALILVAPGCGDAARKAEVERKLVGTWNTTNGSGRIIAFDEAGRVPLFATLTRGTYLVDSAYSQGGGRFEIEMSRGSQVIRVFKRDPDGKENEADRFLIRSIDNDTIELVRERDNPERKATPLVRIDPSPRPSQSDMLKRISDQGYKMIPAGATTMNIDEF